MYRCGQPLDRRRHRGAEQQRLPLGRAAAQNLFDVGPEADVEHPVGFVQHDESQIVERERAAAQVVEHPARRADDHVGAALQFFDLAADRLAAVEGHDVDLPAVGQLDELLAHLDGQLARRHHDQGLRRLRFARRLSRSRIGITKAAVLPVPVRAWPRTSTPASARGSALPGPGSGSGIRPYGGRRAWCSTVPDRQTLVRQQKWFQTRSFEWLGMSGDKQAAGCMMMNDRGVGSDPDLFVVARDIEGYRGRPGRFSVREKPADGWPLM